MGQNVIKSLQSENVCTAKLVQLEERVCENGCGIKFSVLASSEQRLARLDCEKKCFGLKNNSKIARNRTKCLHGKSAKNRLGRAQRDINSWKEKFWNNCVRNAGLMIKAKDIHSNMDIAQYADAACKFCEKKTSYFASEINKDPQLLKHLIDIYHRVFKHLDPNEADFVDWDLLNILYENLKDGDSKMTVKKELNKQIKLKYADKFDNLFNHMKETKNFMCDPLLDLTIAADQTKLGKFYRQTKDLLKVLDSWERNRAKKG